MLINEEVAQILLKIEAIDVSLTHPFKYASGLYSPIYTNCRVLSSHPNERNTIVRSMIEQINGLRDKIDVVAGAGTSSIFLASLVAQSLKLPMIYIRPKRKTHGKKKEIEGVFKKGNRVLLVSDIISTENDIPNSIESIQKKQGVVVHCLAIFNNNMGKIDQFLRDKDIPYTFLTDLTTLLDIALKKGRLSLEEKIAIEEWAKDPQSWNEKRNKNLDKLLKDNKKKVAETLLEIGAVTINSKNPFKFTSGILSPIYTDHRLLISHPTKWKYIVDSFITNIVNIIGAQNIDIIAGTATSGIPHATLIADKLSLPMVYVKFERDEKGEQSKLEGRIKEGDRVVLIEDHVTTGKSALQSATALKESGAIVDWCVAIFTYDTENSKSIFKKEKINLITLCDLSTLLDIGIEKDYITFAEKQAVLEWVENPEYWAWKKNNHIRESNGIKST